MTLALPLSTSSTMTSFAVRLQWPEYFMLACLPACLYSHPCLLRFGFCLILHHPHACLHSCSTHRHNTGQNAGGPSLERRRGLRRQRKSGPRPRPGCSRRAETFLRLARDYQASPTTCRPPIMPRVSSRRKQRIRRGVGTGAGSKRPSTSASGRCGCI